MKPNLILGLGNPLMGDDGIGWRVAELLAADPRLPADTEVACAGTDLLRWAAQMEGRRTVMIVDALLEDGISGSVEIVEDRFTGLEIRQWNVHHLSAPHAVRLLQAALPELCGVRFTFVAIAIASIEARPTLSHDLEVQLPEILARVLHYLSSKSEITRGADRSDAKPRLSRCR